MLAQSFLAKCGREKETSYGETQDYNGNYRSISLVGNNKLNSLVPKSNKVWNRYKIFVFAQQFQELIWKKLKRQFNRWVEAGNFIPIQLFQILMEYNFVAYLDENCSEWLQIERLQWRISY